MATESASTKLESSCSTESLESVWDEEAELVGIQGMILVSGCSVDILADIRLDAAPGCRDFNLKGNVLSV